MEYDGEECVLRHPTPLEDIVTHDQIIEVHAGFPQQEGFDRVAREADVRVSPMERRDGGDRLVSEESVAVVERGDKQVHGLLAWNVRDGCGNVAPHPHILLLVAHGMLEPLEYRHAVADEGITCPAL